MKYSDKKKIVTISLRIPEEVHRGIVKMAEEEKRSFNGQVVCILERKLNEKDK